MINEGKYKARATGQVVLGKSANKGTPFIELYFQVFGDENDAPEEVRWTGYFTDRTAERTIESLQYAGWDGENLAEFADGGLHGLDSNEVQIVVEHEEYEDRETGEPKKVAKVAWVNKVGGFLNVQNAMKKEEADVFGDKMRGLALKLKAKGPAKADSGTDFPHGENVAPKTGTGGRKGW